MPISVDCGEPGEGEKFVDVFPCPPGRRDQAGVNFIPIDFIKGDYSPAGVAFPPVTTSAFFCPITARMTSSTVFMSTISSISSAVISG